LRLGIAEILDKADKAETFEAKKRIIYDNFSKTLGDIVRAAYDPTIKFLLPKGPITFQANPLFDCQNVLYVEARKLYLFVEGGRPDLTDEKRLKLFQIFLGNLDKDDAILMMHVKDKFLPYKTLTREVMKNIFPNLIIEKETKQ